MDVYQGDNLRVSYVRDGMGRVLARSSPTPTLQGPVSFYHGRDIHRWDAMGRLLESYHYGPDGVSGLYQREEFAYDGLGRRLRESFKFLYGSNQVDVESGFTGGDPVRTSVHYDNSLAADADDLWLERSAHGSWP